MHTIVLDIDDTIATAIDLSSYKDDSVTSFIERQKAIGPETLMDIEIRDTVYTHYIHHGVFELLQWLATLPNVQCVFFSRGITERNEYFASELLKRALPGEKYRSFRENSATFSREDCFDTEITRNQRAYQPKSNSLFGNSKKDLQVIVDYYQREHQRTLLLEKMILVDDDPSWVIRGQEANYLYVSGASLYEFIGGRKDDFLRKNHIFYVANILETILNTPSPTETLFDLSFTDEEPVYHALFQEKARYHAGLKTLQTVNPSLQLL